jgi:hypothetical protein
MNGVAEIKFIAKNNQTPFEAAAAVRRNMASASGAALPPLYPAYYASDGAIAGILRLTAT